MRTEPVTLAGPKGLKAVYEGLRCICPELPFEVRIMELEDGAEFDMYSFHIRSMRVNHKITCYAYSVEVKRAGRFDVERAIALNIPKKYWNVLQKGNNVDYEGKLYTPDMVLGEARRGLKVSYCTDTRPVAALPAFVEGSDLFICEGMYGEQDKLAKAKEYKHMLFSEAAELAKRGKVKELWLTHFSPAMPFPEEFIDNARSIFKNTLIGKDRKHITLMFDEE
jgi:ribonuclease Z